MGTTVNGVESAPRVRAALIQGLASEADDMKWIEDRDYLGQFLSGC